jgi:hypothetical protein
MRFLSDEAVSDKVAFMWFPGPIAWRLGTARFAQRMNVSGYDLPRMLDSVAPLRNAGVVRLVAHVASQRAGKKAAREWLHEHADYARPILDTLARVPDEKEGMCAAAALELLSEKTPKEARPPTRSANTSRTGSATSPSAAGANAPPTGSTDAERASTKRPCRDICSDI